MWVSPVSEPSNAESPQPHLDPTALVASTSADVWRLHAHLVGAAEADDLTQETYERVLRALPGFRGDASVRTWVLAIAARVAADDIRRRQRRRRLGGLFVREAPVSDHAGSLELNDLLQRLEPARREAFVLTQVLELSYDEAARLLDIPIGTIRSRVARARADLVRAMDGDE
jgi:RNA polymerase sigma-70 factor (ECF subfamily)